ncbi:kinase-like domain-containing protein [Rhizoctonia solani]|nr:kinase-like domain-containing protein [Rhizoctonia solani]
MVQAISTGDRNESIIVPGKISGLMSPGQMMEQLSQHGCRSITDQLDLSRCGKYPLFAGGFGDVFQGTLRDGTQVAIKCLRILAGSMDQGGKQLKAAARELNNWSKCKHRNIMELIGVALYNDRIAMVSPWMANSNLSVFLSRHPRVDRYSMCVQIADGVTYLHEHGVVHGDIKCINIMVSHDHTPKISDFGSSGKDQNSLSFTGTKTGFQTTTRYAVN